jgi:NAD(P)-dependent dehydrogenase (short-subunit alcohol dehydrogenase family)
VDIGGAAAVVTGGAGGLGEATVRHLAGRGCHVVVADLAEEKGRALADELAGAATFVRTDATSENDVERAIDAAVGQVAYASAKGGVVAMTLPAARDLAVLGVRVVTIAPGTMRTPAYGSDLDQVEAHWAPSVPFPKRMGRPDEYGRLVLGICDNPYLNGEVVRLDGALRFTPRGAG